MSDRDASISDAAFRAALDEVMRLSGKAAGVTVSDTTAAHLPIVQQLLAAHARVLALYAEAQQQGERDQLALAEQVAEATMRMEQGRAERQGEVYEVAFIQPDCGDPTVPEHAEEWGVGLHGTMPGWLHPGDRVRVTKVEEGQ